MPSGKMSDEGLSYEKTGTSMGESARATAAIFREYGVCLCRLVVTVDGSKCSS
jgi:hypothetical protein